MNSVRKMLRSVASVALSLAILTGVAAAQQVYTNNYYIPMNGPYQGASQWFQLTIQVYPNGIVDVSQVLTNDVAFAGWCGSYVLRLSDLSNRTLLLNESSGTYCVPSKGPDGHEYRGNAGVVEYNIGAAAAQRIIAHPDVWAASTSYEPQTWDFRGVLQLVLEAGQLVAYAL